MAKPFKKMDLQLTDRATIPFDTDHSGARCQNARMTTLGQCTEPVPVASKALLSETLPWSTNCGTDTLAQVACQNAVLGMHTEIGHDRTGGQSVGTQSSFSQATACRPGNCESGGILRFPNKELAKQHYMRSGGEEHIARLARKLGKDEGTLAGEIGFVIQMVETIDGQPSSFEVMGLQAYIPTSDSQGNTEVRFSAKGHYIHPGIRSDGTIPRP